jgi:hypothetical protein
MVNLLSAAMTSKVDDLPMTATLPWFGTLLKDCPPNTSPPDPDTEAVCTPDEATPAKPPKATPPDDATETP